jgi:CcmD family protein
VSDVAWLFIAFMAVWAGIGAYLLTLGARQKRLERRLADLASERPHAPGR